MSNFKITPRETLDLHELIAFKVITATKAQAVKGLVKDKELKKMIEQDYETLKDHISELKELIKTSEYA